MPPREYTAAMTTEMRGVRPIVGAVLGGAWALAGGACSSYQDPSLRVTDVAVRSRSPEAMVVEFSHHGMESDHWTTAIEPVGAHLLC